MEYLVSHVGARVFHFISTFNMPPAKYFSIDLRVLHIKSSLYK